MGSVEDRIEEAKLRISNVDFLKPLTVGYVQGILPCIQQKIDKNREVLYKLREKVPVKRRLKQGCRGRVFKKVQGLKS